MAQRLVFVVLLILAVALSTCRPGPVIGGPKQAAGGTIAGIVTATAGSVALPGRKVTAIEVNTQARYEATTASNGGYTIQVPEGTYRIELELRAGEMLDKAPAETEIRNSDLDSGRDFVVTVKPQ